MFDGLVISALSLVPRRRTAWWMGALARTGVSRLGVRLFAWAYGVKVDEAELPLAAYPTLEAFFTRRLRAGARPVDPDAAVLASPVDGRVAFVGRTVGGLLEPEPGRPLSLSTLLGEPVDDERDVIVLYLSPKDYHRVHASLDAVVTGWRYVPGTLWPVFPAAARTLDGLLARNERLVALLDSQGLTWQAVLVGAFGVGRIEVPFTDLLTNTGAEARDEGCAHSLTRGDELGVFHLGSTVVLSFPEGTWRWRVGRGEPVRMGQGIAART